MPMLTLALASLAQTFGAPLLHGLEPPVLLPNGKEFMSWEAPLSFTHTYFVDQAAANASDDNPGTEQQPFLTISHAAEILQPGERVVIGAGVYRERVSPARGGEGPEAMVSYEAAPGATVVVSGSQVVTEPWTASRLGVDGVWQTTLPDEAFAHENPFAEANLTDEEIDASMPWAEPIKGHPVFALKRGLVFQDGVRLVQVNTPDALQAAPGTYWVDEDGLTIHCHPYDEVDPNGVTVEYTAQGFIFAPQEFGLGYIRVKGLTIEHSGNRFPRPQEGAISALRGHHWIIEDCTVREVNAIGIDIGDQFCVDGPPLAEGGRHIVRNNTIESCGIGGIEGKDLVSTLIEGNAIHQCGWQDIVQIWETGGIKVHCTQDTVIRGNLVTDTIAAPGIWMDYANVNSRCTANLIVDAGTTNGGIFMEASQQPNMVDRNIVIGSAACGIYQHDCDELTIAHNLLAHCDDAGISMQIMEERMVGGRLSTAKRNTITGNIIIDTRLPLAILDPDNACDHNVFVPGRGAFDLDAWRAETGWDLNSSAGGVQLDWDRATLSLSLSFEGTPLLCPKPDAVTYDFLLREWTDDQALPGPFADLPVDRVSLWRGTGSTQAGE